MGKIQLIEKEIKEIKDYIGDGMCNLTELMEQLAVELSNLESLEKDYKKKLSKKYQKKLIKNMSNTIKIINVLKPIVEKYGDVDKDGDVDIEDAKKIVSTIKEHYDLNQDGNVTFTEMKSQLKADLKDMNIGKLILEIILVALITLFVLYYAFDGQMIDLMISGNKSFWEAFSSIFMLGITLIGAKETIAVIIKKATGISIDYQQKLKSLEESILELKSLLIKAKTDAEMEKLQYEIQLKNEELKSLTQKVADKETIIVATGEQK